MSEPAFSDFGSDAPKPESRRLSRAAVASMIIGLSGPVTCVGGMAATVGAVRVISYTGAFGAIVVPIAISLAGLLLGAFAFFLIATRPERYRGAGYAGAGLALNIIGASLNILLVTHVFLPIGKMTSGTILYAIRTIEGGDREKIEAIFHESVREDLSPERLEAFRDRIRNGLGEPQHGARSVGELLEIELPVAAKAARRSGAPNQIPAVPIWFEKGRALVVLSVHEDVKSQLFSSGLTLEELLTDIRVVRENGEIVSLMSP